MSDNGRITSGDAWRTQPMYTISEAAHLAHVAPITVRRWLRGYAPDPRYPEWRMPPVFDEADGSSPYVSFLQLIEIVVASDFRKISRVKLDVIRDAYRNARAEEGIQYPFAHMKLETLGGHIVQWLEDKGIKRVRSVDRPQQFGLPNLIQQRVRDRLKELDFVRQLAARWYPVGKDVPIVVDPRFAAGLPTIDGRGVTVDSIRRRWHADQSMEFIADDLQLELSLVQRALQYADKIAA
jgi:uncharacterized protein (DUF433 family)